MKNIINLLKHNKKGSGIVTVLLAILFLTAFGTLSMYMTYTSTEMVASERRGKIAAYNASTCMDEIKAGVQDIVSDAIISTYGEVMPKYVEYAGNISDVFRSKYIGNILHAENISGDRYFLPASSTDTNGITTYSNGTYNGQNIESLVVEARSENAECTVRCGDGGVSGILLVDNEKNKITLKNIQVTYRDSNGRKSSVISDIEINIPDVGYMLTQYSISGVPSFSLIVGGTIDHTANSGGQNVEINGNYYAKNVNLNGNNTMHITGGGTGVIKEALNISGKMYSDYGNISNPNQLDLNTSYKTANTANKFRFYTDPGTSLWAHDITVSNDSSFSLNGATYVANDLTFNGYRTVGNISGSYYGFGYGYDSSVDEAQYGIAPLNPNESSSIIFNKNTGAKSKNYLFTKNLTDLYLSGVSFISNANRYLLTGDRANGASMGQSVATKDNQMAYFTLPGEVQYYKYVVETQEINEDGHIKTLHFLRFEVDEGMVPHYYCPETNGFYEESYRQTADENGVLHYILDENGNKIETGEYYGHPCSCSFKSHSITDLVPFTDGPYNPDSSVAGVYYFSLEEFEEIAYFCLRGEEYRFETNHWELDKVSERVIPFNGTCENCKNTTFKYNKTGENNYSDNYGIELLPIVKTPTSTQVIVYCFIKFTGHNFDDIQSNANNYFEHYWNHNQAGVNEQLNNYVHFMTSENTGVGTAGNLFASTGISSYKIDSDTFYNTVYSLVKASKVNFDSLRKEAKFIQTIFETYCITLSSKPLDTQADNPFDCYINRAKLTSEIAEGRSVYFYNGGQATAVIINGDYIYNSSIKNSYPNLHMIIATGNVTVSADFNGLVICDKDLIIESGCKLGKYEDGVIEAYDADSINSNHTHNSLDTTGNPRDRFVKDYFNVDISQEYKYSNSKSGDAWNVENLVSFRNWKRVFI